MRTILLALALGAALALAAAPPAQADIYVSNCPPGFLCFVCVGVSIPTPEYVHLHVNEPCGG